MSYKPLFMRPVEITSSTASLMIYENGAAEHTTTIDSGVYSCMAAVLYAFETKVNADNPALTTDIKLVDDGNGEIVVKFTFTNGTGCVNFRDSDAVNNFWGGDRLYSSNKSSITCPYRPAYIWLPKYQVANQARFYKNQKELAVGVQAKTGALTSIATGPTIYYRDIEFNNESAENLLDDAATSVEDYLNMEQRNLDYFVEQARISQPSTSGYPTTKCFWFWQDWNDMLDNPHIFPGGTDGTGSDYEGIHFDSGDSYFAYCQFDDEGYSPATPLNVPTGRTYYDVKFKFHTVSETPTWQDPDQSGGGGG